MAGASDASVNVAWKLGRDNQASYAAMVGKAPELERWATTALFYSALHFTDAALRRVSSPPGISHAARLRAISAHFDTSFLQHYLALKDISERWRYWGYQASAADLEKYQRGHYEPLVAEARRVAQPTIPPGP